MKTIIRFTIFFAITLIVLSFKINESTIFSYLYQFSSPIADVSQKSTHDFINDSIDSTQKYSKKIFSNSVPKIKDTIRSRSSSIKKDNPDTEDVFPNEQKELEELIKSHQ